jgi:hypothetical protein
MEINYENDLAEGQMVGESAFDWYLLRLRDRDLAWVWIQLK